jgi:hypothetical protein
VPKCADNGIHRVRSRSGASTAPREHGGDRHPGSGPGQRRFAGGVDQRYADLRRHRGRQGLLTLRSVLSGSLTKAGLLRWLRDEPMRCPRGTRLVGPAPADTLIVSVVPRTVGVSLTRASTTTSTGIAAVAATRAAHHPTADYPVRPQATGLLDLRTRRPALGSGLIHSAVEYGTGQVGKAV